MNEIGIWELICGLIATAACLLFIVLGYFKNLERDEEKAAERQQCHNRRS